MTANSMVFEYRRSARVEGLETGFIAIVTAIGFGLFVLAGIYPRETAVQVWFLVLFVVAGSLVGLYTIKNLLSPRDFFVRIDAETIEQSVPVWGAGESFRIRLDSIDSVTYCLDPEFRSMTIKDRTGRSFELTINYDNPIPKIVDALKSLGIKCDLP